MKDTIKELIKIAVAILIVTFCIWEIAARINHRLLDDLNDWGNLTIVYLSSLLSAGLILLLVYVVYTTYITKAVAIFRVWHWTRLWVPALRLQEQKKLGAIVAKRWLATKPSEIQTMQSANTEEGEILGMYQEILKSGHAYELETDNLRQTIGRLGQLKQSGTKSSRQMSNLIDTFYVADLPLDGIRNVQHVITWAEKENTPYDMAGKVEAPHIL